MRHLAIFLLLCGGSVATRGDERPGPPVEIPAETLKDKIHGGLLGQLLGTVDGLAHEMRYIDKPGTAS